MCKYLIIILFFCSSLNIFSQKNKKITLNFDDLMSEISQISKANNQYVKYDSVLNILSNMQQKLVAQDSIINTLKKNVNVVQLKSDSTYQIGYYVILGAFKISENAQNLASTKFKYPIIIYRFPSSKLNYVGYKIKSSDDILKVLKIFRKELVRDAWILKVTQ